MMKFSVSKLISTFFYVGFSKVCPGTFGSVATLPLWFFICYLSAKFNLSSPIVLMTILIAILLFFYVIGEITTSIYMKSTGKLDPSEVVIDEVVGQLIAFMMSFSLIYMQSAKIELIMNCECVYLKNGLGLLLLITPIIFFRLFDIGKPWIVGYIDKNIKSAHGVMLDDVFAGLFAGICNVILIYLFLFLIRF